MEAYPFDLMTQHYGFSTQIKGNWKLAVDSVCEWYHPPYVHGRFIDPDVSKAEKMVPPVDSYHYDLFRPHMLTSVPGPPTAAAARAGNARASRARISDGSTSCSGPGFSAPTTCPTSARCRSFLNRGDIASWGNDQFWVFPNISIQIWARNYYITYTYWPETVDTHIYEIDLYFVPPANAHERLAQELVVDSTIEFAMQDVNTIEATHSALEDPGAEHVPPQRPGAAHPAVPHGHPRHRRRPPVRRGAGGMMGHQLPEGFSELEPWVDDWALADQGRALRARGWTGRIDELVEFYDAIAPHAEARHRLPRRAATSTTLVPRTSRLLHLLYSMILVSYAVNIFHQNRIPDSGAAFFDMVAEPAL